MLGVGVAKRSPKAQIAADRVADNAARTALYSLPGTRDPKAEAQIVDRYFEGEDVYALAYLPAPDALAPGANEACPGEPTKRVWSVRPVRGGEQPAPVVAAAKDGVSLQGWSLVLRTPIPSEAQAKLGGYAIAPLRLAALLAEGAFASPKLTDAQRTCLTALPWAQITEKAQSSFDAAALVTVLNIEKIRRAAVTNKCDVRAVTAVLKELRVPKCAPPR